MAQSREILGGSLRVSKGMVDALPDGLGFCLVSPRLRATTASNNVVGAGKFWYCIIKTPLYVIVFLSELINELVATENQPFTTDFCCGESAFHG